MADEADKNETDEPVDGAEEVLEAEPIDVDFEPAPSEPANNTPAPRRGPGWISLGVTALVAATAGGAAGIFLDPDPTIGSAADTSQISEDVTSLAEAQRDAEAKLSDLAKEVTDMEARLGRAPAGAGAESGVADLEKRLAALETALGTAGEPAAQPPLSDALLRVDGLETRLSALENADLDSENLSPRLMNRAVIAMRDRVDALEALSADLQTAQTNRAEALATLSTRLGELESRVETLHETQAEPADLSGLQADIDTVKAALAEAATVDADKLAEYDAVIAELRNNTSATTQRVEETRDTADAALAFAMIEASASRGRPFLLPLNRLSAALPGEPGVAALEPLARSGAPTLGGLALLLEDAAVKSRDAETEAQEDNPWGWVRQTFGDGVSVKRTGAADTAVTDSISIARKALQDGDVDAAIAAIERIEGPQAPSFTPWLEQARQRVTLERNLDRLRLRMISAE